MRQLSQTYSTYQRASRTDFKQELAGTYSRTDSKQEK